MKENTKEQNEVNNEVKYEQLRKLFTYHDKRARKAQDSAMRVGAFLLACVYHENEYTLEESISRVTDEVTEDRKADLSEKEVKSMLQNAIALLPFAYGLRQSGIDSWEDAKEEKGWPTHKEALHLCHADGKSPLSVVSDWEGHVMRVWDMAKTSAFTRLTKSPNFDEKSFSDDHVKAEIVRLAGQNKPRKNRGASTPDDSKNALQKIAALEAAVIQSYVRDMSGPERNKILVAFQVVQENEKAAREAANVGS